MGDADTPVNENNRLRHKARRMKKIRLALL